MSLESNEPSHETFTSLGNNLECPIYQDSLIPTYSMVVSIKLILVHLPS